MFTEKLRGTTFNQQHSRTRSEAATNTSSHSQCTTRNALAMKPLTLVASKSPKPCDKPAKLHSSLSMFYYLRLRFNLLLRRSILPRHEKRLRRKQLEKTLCTIRSQHIFSVPCDRIVQKAYLRLHVLRHGYTAGCNRDANSSMVFYRNADSRWMSPRDIYIGS